MKSDAWQVDALCMIQNWPNPSSVQDHRECHLGVFSVISFPWLKKKVWDFSMFVELALWNVVPFLGDIHLLDTNLQSHTCSIFAYNLRCFCFCSCCMIFRIRKLSVEMVIALGSNFWFCVQTVVMSCLYFMDRKWNHWKPLRKQVCWHLHATWSN